MNDVLIVYPEAFRCQVKFERKVLNILKNMDEFQISYLHDANEFIASLFEGDKRLRNLNNIELDDIAQVSHAIVFDDGEEFELERERLDTNKVPTRWVKIAITRVVNIKHESEYENLKSTPAYEYIGRGSYWGNPYSMYEEGDSREEVIRKYKYDFDYEKFPNKEKSEVYKLAGKRLGCFCKPEACHGDVLADFLNAWDDGG